MLGPQREGGTQAAAPAPLGWVNRKSLSPALPVPMPFLPGVWAKGEMVGFFYDLYVSSACGHPLAASTSSGNSGDDGVGGSVELR